MKFLLSLCDFADYSVLSSPIEDETASSYVGHCWFKENSVCTRVTAKKCLDWCYFARLCIVQIAACISTGNTADQSYGTQLVS